MFASQVWLHLLDHYTHILWLDRYEDDVNVLGNLHWSEGMIVLVCVSTTLQFRKWDKSTVGMDR